ncbi:MAG TPA: hypothetical protein VKR53_07575 [Puia sp.]|nr:hypothetical protein [Puia sp.]
MAPLFVILGLLAQLSPVVLFFVFFKRNKKIIALWVIFFYALLSVISGFLLGAVKNHASLVISYFAICEYFFFAAFFFLSIRNRLFTKIIIAVSIATIGFELFLLYSHIANFDFWAALITAILIVSYSIFFFYEQLNLPETLFIYQSYKFWIVVGCIVYLSGTLFLFLFTSDLKDKQNSSLWIINDAFEIVKNIFFSIAFIIARNNKLNMITDDSYDTNMFEKSF